MRYPIFIHKDPKSDYGVTVPDLPGCFSAGSTIEEAIKNAEEAIECHLEGLLLDDEPIPNQQDLKKHLANRDFKDAILALVDVDITKISGKSRRIDITLPERFLRKIDKYSKQQYAGNRSAFITAAAMHFMATDNGRVK